MTLKALAAEYRAAAALLRVRIRALGQVDVWAMPEKEQVLFRRRMTLLRAMYRETAATARVLEHYYDRGKNHGPFDL